MIPKTTFRTFLSVVTIMYALAWFVPRITEKGLFTDGLVYTTIAHNLAQGIGTTWMPVMRNSDFLYHPQDVFYEHPPLLFVLEAILYRWAGDHTEWIYNSLILLLIVCITECLFRSVFADRQASGLPLFLPVLFLFLAPEWAKKVSYNLLDTTLAMFTAFSVLAVLHGLKRHGPGIGWFLAGGAGVAAAFLVKGPVGLFPLAVPCLYGLMPGNALRRADIVRATGLMLVIPVLVGVALAAYTPARDFFMQYLRVQVLDSMAGRREAAATLANHLGILVKIAEQTAAMLALVLIAGWFLYLRKGIQSWRLHPATTLFLLIALSASAPILVSAKHHSFYLYPAMVFYALAAASQVAAMMPESAWQARSRLYSRGSLATVAIVALIMVKSSTGEPRYYRTHADFLGAMDALMAGVPAGATIAAPERIRVTRADVNGYLERYYDAELIQDPMASLYFLAFQADSLPDRDVANVNRSGQFQLVTWQSAGVGRQE